jgi:hypothetical protein
MMLVAVDGHAQVRAYDDIIVLEDIQAGKLMPGEFPRNQNLAPLSGSFEIRRPIGEIYNRTPWPNPNPMINFQEWEELMPAGDLDGDGTGDLVSHYPGRPDPRDDDPATLTGRTLVFYSGTALFEPEHVFFDLAYPAGDLTGNGKSKLISGNIFENPILYTFNETGVETAQFELDSGFQGRTQTINRTMFNADLDGSGFNDMVFTVIPPVPFEHFYVLYGASEAAGFELRAYDFRDFMPGWAPDFQQTAYLSDVFTHNGQSYIVLLANQSSPAASYAVLITINADRSASLEQIIEFGNLSQGWTSGLAFAAVLDAGSAPSLILTHDRFATDKAFYYPVSTDGGPLFRQEPSVLHSQVLWSGGNLNSNGTTDFITRETADGPLRLAGFPSGLSSGLVFGEALPGQETVNPYPFSNPFACAFCVTNMRFGDLTGDGRDDHVVSYVNSADLEAGYLLIRGGDTPGFESQVVDVRDYIQTRAEHVYALGDVTGNGADDFAVYYNSFPSPNSLVFFEGGVNWKTPARIWDIGDRDITDVLAGNFMDSGRRDIVVMTSSSEGSMVELYHGGGIPGDAPLRSVSENQVYPGISILYVLNTMANAGDVNNSGYDDLIIASAFRRDQVLGPLPAVIYLGGPDFMNGAPEVSIGFADVDLGPGIGSTLAGLGDINGDGIDDFAVVNLSQGGTADRQAYGVGGGGRINIFYGRDGNADFGNPDLVLRQDAASMSAGYEMSNFGMSEIATGDFNGNGYRGIAAKPTTHRRPTNPAEGSPSVHVFNGLIAGDQPDQLLPLYNSVMSISASDFEYVPFAGRMLMTGIPDLTSNGRDELLMIGGSGTLTNAVLHYGRDRFNEMPDVVFEAPNRSVGMGAREPGVIVNRQYRSAVGDFNGDGKLNFLVVQRLDMNYRDTPVYMYELGRPGGVQVQVASTEPVGSTGGTVENQETRTKVVIPAGAIETEVEIEVGTFTVVPEGATVSGMMIYLGPPGTTFSEPVEVTVSYDPDNLPEGVQNEEDLVLLRYDESTSEWEELPSEVNTTDKTVTGTTMRFSGFGAGAIKAAVSIGREDDHGQLPAKVELHQNYPNPFNPVTVIGFTLPADAEVRLEVFNILGERVAVLADERRTAGTHQVSFNASRLSSGVYLYRLTTGDRVQTRKMMLIK